MLTSAQQTFSNKQAITATAASTNYIDLGYTGTPVRGNKLMRDIGKGEPIHIEAQVTAAFNTLTSLKIAVEVADNDAFSSGKVEVLSQTIPLAGLTAGQSVSFQFVPNGVNKRYLRMYYTVAGTNPTTGAIWSGISLGRQTNK